MRMRYLKFLSAALLAGLLVGPAIGRVAAQSIQSTGGAFLPALNYVMGGTWTWLGASPLVFEGATNNGVSTTIAITDPTAARTITVPDATDTLVGKATTDILTNKTLTSPTLTTPVLASFTNTGTETMPSATGGIPVSLFCGSTGVGNQTCTATAASATTKVYSGNSTLSTNAAVITFSPAFASTTYVCVANDITTRANPVQMLSTSASTATITNTTGASDVINWVCVGQ